MTLQELQAKGALGVLSASLQASPSSPSLTLVTPLLPGGGPASAAELLILGEGRLGTHCYCQNEDQRVKIERIMALVNRIEAVCV